MHSSDQLPEPPSSGPSLLQQLGRLIIRARSRSRSPHDPRDRLLKAKLIKNQPSTSTQVVGQPRSESESRPQIETQLDTHVQALWNEKIPICIEVLLAPDCAECYTKATKTEGEAAYDRLPSQDRRVLLLERWTMSVILKKTQESPSFITSRWLLNAVRSQLHFSQLSAWLARLSTKTDPKTLAEDTTERKRKLSRETCNIKKLEANCDERELLKISEDHQNTQRKLNIVYSIKIPGESYKMTEFTRTPTDHTFPITDIGNNVFLKVILESLPRIDDIPTVKCTCNVPKRRASKEMPSNLHEDLTHRLNDLTLGPDSFRSHFAKDLCAINSNIGCASGVTRRMSVYKENEHFAKESPGNNQLLDDRMHTPCNETGKHKCSCDDESDPGKEIQKSPNCRDTNTKKLDERRLKEIAKYKRRLRKETKLKMRDSNSESTGNSEGEGLNVKTNTSIPILLASRFDRFRAIGCYRNQTYLTLPATRIETKSPVLIENQVPIEQYRRTNSVSTQTEDFCTCGAKFSIRCENCAKTTMVRSEANYDLASLNDNRRRIDDDEKVIKKHRCDKISDNINDNKSKICDIISSVSGVRKCPDDNEVDNIIKRPKLKRFFPIVDRIEKLISDREAKRERDDIEELLLKDDDTVFANVNNVSEKRQKYSSISEDYVLYEKFYYGSYDKVEVESPKEVETNGFDYPESKSQGKDGQIPSPTEMDRFRYRFDSAASMVFHTKTGLPLTSSPAPIKRGNNCFDYDDSINGVSGIKSALYHPTPEPSSPATPVSKLPTKAPQERPTRPRLGPSAGLLGSFEESALKGRLEPVATVHGFTAELGASGAFCPPHRRLPVTVFFYAPGGTNAPYMGHIHLGSGGYRVSKSGTIQVSLFNPHGTLVKMFVVLYDLTSMPASAKTFLRQRTLYLPAGSPEPPVVNAHKYMRYLIHLRFMTSKSGKLYLHTDIRLIVSRKADMDTATAHSAILKPPANHSARGDVTTAPTNRSNGFLTNGDGNKPCRVFGGSSEFELGYENQSSVAYELRSFTYGPENPKYSPR